VVAWCRKNPLWLAAIVVAVIAVAVNIFTAMGAVLPLYWEDEAGYLANAQVMAGVGFVPELSGRPYYIGWSLLLVPFWWILQDGQAVYLAGVALSAACGIAAGIPLTLIARRLGLAWPLAVIAASVIVLAPSKALYSGFAMSESLLTLAVALAVWAALRFAERASVPRALLLSVFVSLAFLTHGRAVPLLIATVLWFVWSLRSRPVASIVGIVAAATMSGAGFLLYRHVAALIYGTAGVRESNGLERLFGPDPLATLVSAVGQIWFVTFSWVGLTVFGCVVLYRATRREISTRAPGVALWSALSLLGISAISFTFIAAAVARGASRLDIYSYGRYLDPFVVPLALVGLVLVMRGLSRRVALGGLIAVVVTAVAWFAIVFPQLPDSGLRLWFPINILGSLQYPWRGTTWLPAAPWLYMSLVVIAALVVVYLFRAKRVVLVALLAFYFVASSVVGELRIVRPFFSEWNVAFTLRGVILDNPLLAGRPVSLDTQGLREIGDSVTKNGYQTLLAPERVILVDSDDEAPTTDLVIARQDWVNAERFGARKIADDTGQFSNALWVMPGELQSQLESEGLLIPEHTQ